MDTSQKAALGFCLGFGGLSSFVLGGLVVFGAEHVLRDPRIAQLLEAQKTRPLTAVEEMHRRVWDILGPVASEEAFDDPTRLPILIQQADDKGLVTWVFEWQTWETLARRAKHAGRR